MKQRVLTFDGRALGRGSLEAPGRLRWASWHPSGHHALVAGDSGTLITYGEGHPRAVKSGTAVNLRCAEYSPDGALAYACGNDGMILRLSEAGAEPLDEGIHENLRRVAWEPSGKRALFVGNDGAAHLSSEAGFHIVHGADTHLRTVAWHPSGGYALVGGNCFRDSVGGLSPSPNLFVYRGNDLEMISTTAESRADLIAASWDPDASSCLLVGFDQTWHTPAVFSYRDDALSQVVWGNENIFPTACAWHPSGEYALIGTSRMTPEEGATALYKFDGRTFTKLEPLEGAGVSCIAWSKAGLALIISSPSMRAFLA